MTSPPSPTSAHWARWLLHLYHQSAQQEPTLQDLPKRLGTLDLAPHQQLAAARLLTCLARYGGGLLADGVGMGKTRVALSVAAWWPSHKPTLICAPARLLPMWRQACLQAGLGLGQEVFLLSHHSLSNAPPHGHIEQAASAGLLIIDEAHHFRNPKTKRAQTLARYAAQTPTLLVSATPICNSVWDLYHLLKLFLAEDDMVTSLGSSLQEAFAQAELGRADLTPLAKACIVRRDRLSGPLTPKRPDVALELLPYENSDNERWLWFNLEPTLRSLSWAMLDGQWPKPMLIEHLMRRWESGPQALLTSLIALTTYAQRWLEADALGKRLDRREAAALFDEDDASQGLLPFVFDTLAPATPALDASRAQIEDELEQLHDLIARVETLQLEGCGRLGAIAALLSAEPFTKALIFSSYEDTAQRLFDTLSKALGPKAQIGLVTGKRSIATGLGRANPEQLLARFAPIAQGVQPPAPNQRLRVLIATDCLSQGVNLQDCGCVILTDLPYSPLLVEQRVGRLVRPGGEHLRVRVILPRPRDWRDSLGLVRRLDHKLAHAAQGLSPMPLSGALFTANTTTTPTPEPTAQSSQIWRALDELDTLCALYLRQEPPALDPPHWALTCTIEALQGRSIGFALYQSGESQQLRLFSDAEEGAQPLPLHELPRILVALIDSSSELADPSPNSPNSASSPWLNALQQAAQAHLALLNSLQLAPPKLPATSVQWQLWQHLLTQANLAAPGRRAALATALTRLEPRLLRPLNHGLELRLRYALEHHQDTLLQELTAWLPEPAPLIPWRIVAIGSLQARAAA